ncbi:hypothetical protein SH139x_002493 [Planctomycetaceae bacterium SH139]
MNLSDQVKPTLGLDLDGCVDEAPKFFSTLSQFWPGEVIVVTYRSDRAKAIADLERHGIKFTDVVLVSSFDAKAEVIKERKINVYIDDQPEMLKNIPVDVSVMLFRNEGNFDFDDRKWMFSNETGKMV